MFSLKQKICPGSARLCGIRFLSHCALHELQQIAERFSLIGGPSSRTLAFEIRNKTYKLNCKTSVFAPSDGFSEAELFAQLQWTRTEISLKNQTLSKQKQQINRVKGTREKRRNFSEKSDAQTSAPANLMSQFSDGKRRPQVSERFFPARGIRSRI